MKQNINTPIMPDSTDSSNQSSLLQYEIHVRLMYEYAIASFIFIVMVCFLTGCTAPQTIYPDSKEFARICNEAREKGGPAEILYDEKLQRDSKQGSIYYPYNLYDTYIDGQVSTPGDDLSSPIVFKNGRKDYIFGKDRTESNIFKKIINADKEKIHNIKEELKTIRSKKEDVIVKISPYGAIIERDKKILLKDLEQELFLLENYYGEIIEQRIDETSLITKEEFLIRNKKTQAIAFKGIYYNLYADRSRFISKSKDPAKVEYYTKHYTKSGNDGFIEFQQDPVDSCDGDLIIVGQSNEP